MKINHFHQSHLLIDFDNWIFLLIYLRAFNATKHGKQTPTFKILTMCHANCLSLVWIPTFFGDTDVDDFALVMIFHFPSHTAITPGGDGVLLGAAPWGVARGGQGRLATPQSGNCACILKVLQMMGQRCKKSIQWQWQVWLGREREMLQASDGDFFIRTGLIQRS